MISRGDRVTVQDWPEDYPLMVLAIVSGRVAIGSPMWPVGANHPVDLHQITSVNGDRVHFEPITNTSKRQRKAA